MIRVWPRLLLAGFLLFPLFAYPLLTGLELAAPVLAHVKRVFGFFADYPGWILFAFVTRVFLLIPVSLLLLLTGTLFGLWWGQAIALAGLILGGSVEFLLIRQGVFAGGRLGRRDDQGYGARWRRRLHDYPFQSLLIMRVMLVPFDLANFLAAWAGMRWPPFLAATALGVIPAAFPVIAVGAALPVREWLAGNVLLGARSSINYATLGMAGAALALSLLIGVVLRRRADRA